MHLIPCLQAELDFPSADEDSSQGAKKGRGEERGGHERSFSFVCLLFPAPRAAQPQQPQPVGDAVILFVL